MIALYLIAAHLLGDFVFQTRWQAAGKFTDPWIRMRHVDAYIVPFVPIVVWRCWGSGAGWRGVAFMVALYVLHFLTDSRRFTSTLGDWTVWRMGRERNIAGTIKDPGDVERPIYVSLPPNPWTPVSILIDQTVHVCQLALLAGVLL